MDELLTGMPRGQCVGGCSTTQPCPSGFACLELTVGDPATKACLPKCTTSANCRQGYVCAKYTSELICTGQCTSNSDCPVKGVCDPYYGVCGLQTLRPGPGEVGDPCVRDADCKSDFCIADTEFSGGYCTAFCSLAAPFPGGCPAGSSCEVDLGMADLGGGAHNCSSDSNCRPGYLCLYSPRHDAQVCWP